MSLDPRSLTERIRLVRYRAFDTALRHCQSLDQSPPGTIAFIVGPSGCGKSALSCLLGPVLYGNSDATSFKPWIRVSVENAQAGYFTSKYLIGQILTSLQDPFYGMNYSMPSSLTSDEIARLSYALGRIPRGSGASEEAQRLAAISLARIYKCRMLIIDEANLMILIKKGRPVEVYMESIRTLAKAMGVRILMFGTLATLEFVDYSAQITRASHIIHLDRLQNRTRDDVTEFLSFLDSIESDVGLEQQLLTKNAEAVYEATYGIPGELVVLLERARAKSFVSGRGRIELRDIEAAYLGQKALNRMRQEADLIEEFVGAKPSHSKAAITKVGKTARPPRVTMRGAGR